MAPFVLNRRSNYRNILFTDESSSLSWIFISRNFSVDLNLNNLIFEFQFTFEETKTCLILNQI